jgi:hypothetical protein
VFERVLDCKERDDELARDICTEVGDEVTQIILFVRAHRTVGEKDERAATRQPFHGMVGIDPRLHSRAGLERCSRRPQLGGDNRRARTQGGEKVVNGHAKKVWESREASHHSRPCWLPRLGTLAMALQHFVDEE